MRLSFRLSRVAAVLMCAAAPLAGAETPMPDPIAPAVIGRPIEQIRPARRVGQKHVVARTNRPKPMVVSKKAAPAAPVAATSVAVAPAVAQEPAAAPHAPKQALDDHVDLQARMADDVGRGARLGRKPSGSGAYLNSQAQALVRKYYDTHPTSPHASSWKIGETVPKRAEMTGVPDNVRAVLPRVPPGHQYVQLDGEVVLVAVQSRMVVDGVSRGAR